MDWLLLLYLAAGGPILNPVRQLSCHPGSSAAIPVPHFLHLHPPFMPSPTSLHESVMAPDDRLAASTSRDALLFIMPSS